MRFLFLTHRPQSLSFFSVVTCLVGLRVGVEGVGEEDRVVWTVERVEGVCPRDSDCLGVGAS